jgi:hypothetical protein
LKHIGDKRKTQRKLKETSDTNCQDPKGRRGGGGIDGGVVDVVVVVVDIVVDIVVLWRSLAGFQLSSRL